MDCETLIAEAIKSFLADPPDTEYQRGYLAALVSVAEDAEDLGISLRLLDQANKLLEAGKNEERVTSSATD